MATKKKPGGVPERCPEAARVGGVGVRATVWLVAAGIGLLGLMAAERPVQAKAPEGWLYIHKYLGDKQREQFGGIATAPIYIHDESGSLVSSTFADGIQEPGRLIPVPEGTYFVTAGRFNLGLTRQRYPVRAGKVTVIQTGFVRIETWPQQEQPKQGCAPWDAEMTLFGTKAGQQVPIFSNAKFQYKTKHFGMIQILAGSYRLSWHGFDVPVEIRAGQIYQVPLGTVGPLAYAKGRVSRNQEDVDTSRALRMCDDGPIHIISGQYWISYAKPLDEYPFEERLWQQVDVTPNNQPGYDTKKLSPDKIGKPLLGGPEADPVAVPTEQDTLEPLDSSAAEKSGGDSLGNEIQWDSPP